MVSKWAVYLVGFVHILLGLSLFLMQSADSCSPAPPLASYIFAGTVLLASANIKLFPKRYTHLPYYIQFLVEMFGTLIILEFCDLVVWCRLERIIHNVMRLGLLFLGMDAKAYMEYEYWILLIPTTALAISVVFILNQATQFISNSLLPRHRINIHVKRELYQEMMTATLKNNNTQNRRATKGRF